MSSSDIDHRTKAKIEKLVNEGKCFMKILLSTGDRVLSQLDVSDKISVMNSIYSDILGINKMPISSQFIIGEFISMKKELREEGFKRFIRKISCGSNFRAMVQTKAQLLRVPIDIDRISELIDKKSSVLRLLEETAKKPIKYMKRMKADKEDMVHALMSMYDISDGQMTSIKQEITEYITMLLD